MVQTVSSMIKASGIGDLYRIYTFAKRDGLDFNYTSIPDDYQVQSEGFFDTAEMNRLFDLGYEMAINGIQWKKVPPGLE
jgi:hypothetical protein